MIFPYVAGLKGWRSAVTTVLLVLINMTVFVYTETQAHRNEMELRSLYSDTHFTQAQGQAYAHYLLAVKSDRKTLLVQLADGATSGNFRDRQILGRLSMRDPEFVFALKDQSRNLASDLDPVMLQHWTTHSKSLLTLETSDIFDDLGLSWLSVDRSASQGSVVSPLVQLVTYQFTHAGWAHLMVNTWFLVVFGLWLERKYGSLFTLFLTVGGGVFAALCFLAWSGPTATPLVGASGAVSTLMGFVAAERWGKSIRMIYWVLPVRGFFGFAKVPASMALAMWLLADLGGHFSQNAALGGVAHSAHLGGLFLGLSLGFLFRSRSKTSAESVLAHVPLIHKL